MEQKHLLEIFVAQQNVSRFQALLASAADDDRRQVLQDLLDAENAKVRAMTQPKNLHAAALPSAKHRG